MTAAQRESFTIEVQDAFRQLDHARLYALGTGAPAELSDAERVALAFGALAHGDPEGADRLLAGASADGTAPLADLAYVRAFRAESRGDHEGVIRYLRPHLSDTRATHGPRMRLRMADAALKINRPDIGTEALQPLLQPPGTPETLEAYLIVLESMLVAKYDKEKVIETSAIVDVLLERGFRLPQPGNVVYYARLLEAHRIEALVPALLKAHEVLLDRYQTEDEGDILFLLGAGEKHKVPAAVRAAARGYARKPFRIKEHEPDKVAFVFGTHEEHAASCRVLETHFAKDRIARDQALWGPYLLSSYCAGRWQTALDVIVAHRSELQKNPAMRDNSAMLRVVCEFHLGRDQEALAGIQRLGAAFHREARGLEAACEPLALLRIGQTAKLADAIARAFAVHADDAEFKDEYANAVTNDLLIRDGQEGLRAWLPALFGSLPAESRSGALQSLAEMMAEWAMPSVILAAEPLLDDIQAARKAYFRGLAAALSGDEATMRREFESAIANPGLLKRESLQFALARWLRRYGHRDEALKLAEALAAGPFPARHAAMALRIGLLEDMGGSVENMRAEKAKLDEHLRAKAPSREGFQMMFFEATQFLAGDAPERTLAAARQAEAVTPGSIETLRLARKAARAHDATADVREAALKIEAAWMAQAGKQAK